MLGHSLGTAWAQLGHSLGTCVHFQAVSKLGHALQRLQQRCCLSDKLYFFENTFKLCFGSAIVLLLQTAFECTGGSASTMYLVYKLMHILHTHMIIVDKYYQYSRIVLQLQDKVKCIYKHPQSVWFMWYLLP